MLDVKVLLTKILDALKCDYIVEQGTANGWTYRKWNSGISECWATITATSVAMTTAEGYGYYAPLKTFTYPTGLFIDNPTTTLGVHLAGSIGGFNPSYNSNAELRGYFWATRSKTKTVYLYVHSIGHWK